jgi:hypothetical protein
MESVTFSEDDLALLLEHRAFEAYQRITREVEATGGQLVLEAGVGAGCLAVHWPNVSARMRILVATPGIYEVYLLEHEENPEPEKGVVPPDDDEATVMELGFTVAELRKEIDLILVQRSLRLMLAYDGNRVSLLATEDGQENTLANAYEVASFRRFKSSRWPKSADDIRPVSGLFRMRIRQGEVVA